MTDLVVVGGGIVGVATCFYARQFGMSCTLIEQDAIAGHASGFAFGGLNPRLETTASSDMSWFARSSFNEHQTLSALLENEFGTTSSWRKRASVSLAWSDADVIALRNRAAALPTVFQWLDRSALRELEPRLSTMVLGGLFTEESAEVNAAELTVSLARSSRANLIRSEVAGVVVESERVRAVRLQNDTLIEGDHFVFALGPWSASMFSWFELDIQVRPLKGQILRLKMAGKPFAHSFSTRGNYMSSKPDGLVWIGTTEEDVGFDVWSTAEAREEILSVLRQMCPSLSDIRVVTQTACLRPISPDGNIVLGPVPGVSNAFVGTGGGRKGILYGPLMGKHLAELAAGSADSQAWQSLAPSRFLHTS